jgi:alpha,alpha-trehalase
VTDLRERWDEVAGRLTAARMVCVLCDFDGTIAPLVERPEKAEILPKARRALEAIAASSRGAAGVLSGRALGDVESRTGLAGLWYVGIHGFELKTPAGELRQFFETSDAERAKTVQAELAQSLSAVPGVLIEIKGPVLAVHYRMVEESLRAGVERAFFEVMERHRRELMIGRGKLVLEARPRSVINKGAAVRMIRRELPSGAAVIYFGDDLTDRDAFRALEGVGTSVEVTAEPSTLADYTLPGPDDVADVLVKIQDLVKERRPSRRIKRR